MTWLNMFTSPVWQSSTGQKRRKNDSDIDSTDGKPAKMQKTIGEAELYIWCSSIQSVL